MIVHNHVNSGGVCSKQRRIHGPATSLGLCISGLDMPVAASRPCRQLGCNVLVSGESHCEAHRRAAPGSFADADRGSRHERGYGGQWDKIRPRILRRDGGLCQECLRNGIVNECASKKFGAFVDHKIPRFEGGTDDDDNLQTLCRRCHNEKTQSESARARRQAAG